MSTSFRFTVPAMVHVVVAVADWRSTFAAVVKSDAAQDQPFAAVYVGVRTIVLAPVVPVQVNFPAIPASPEMVVIVAQAPVPVMA